MKKEEDKQETEKEALLQTAHVVRQEPFNKISVSVIHMYVCCKACVYWVVM